MSKIVDDYLALTPGDLPYLRRLTVSEEQDLITDAIEIRLELEFSGEDRSEVLIVRCAGVRDLAFEQPFTTDMNLHSLEVEDLSGSGMELIRFKVHDVEGEALSFQSRTFEAERRSIHPQV